jgi:hypothetical protein
MFRCLAILMIALTVSPSVVLAQNRHAGSEEQQRACRSDVARFCRGVRGDYAIADCLRDNMSRLRASCRKVMEGR